MSDTLESAVKVIKAEEPSSEFRSVWTDLRGASFEQGFLDVKGTRIRYLRSGSRDAPKILMLPGTGGHTETFAPNVGPLGKRFECWAIDIPGCGYSDKGKAPSEYDALHTAKFVKDWADVVGAKQIDIVGCSVGAWNALQTARLYPDLVKHLVLISPAGGPMPEPDDPMYKFWTSRDIGGGQAADRAEMLKNPTFEGAKKILSALIPDARRLPDDMVAARLDVNRQPGARHENAMWYLDYDTRMANTLTKEQLRQMKVPVLAVIEVDDQNRDMVYKMVDALPNCRLVKIDGVGHWAHYEAPSQFNAMTLEFLAGK